MKRILTVVYITVVMFMASGPVFAASKAAIVNDANKLYNDGKYNEALKKYGELDDPSKVSDIIDYNTGAALYKKYEYDRAEERFSKTLVTDNPELEAKANYNIGNSKYKIGKMTEQGKQGTVARLYREALEYYKRAIELDQEDGDAKFNYEYVKKELDSLLSKNQQKQQQQKKQDKKDQKDREDSQDKKDNPDGGKNNEERQSQQEREESDQKEESEQDKKEEDGADRDGGRQEQEPERQKDEEETEDEGHPEEEPAPGEMSEEEARMLLDGHKQQEEPDVNMQKRRTHYEVLKDW